MCVCVCASGVWMGREGVWHPVPNPVWWDSSVTRFYPLLRNHASPRLFISVRLSVCDRLTASFDLVSPNFHWHFFFFRTTSSLTPSLFDVSLVSPTQGLIQSEQSTNGLTANVVCKAEAACVRAAFESRRWWSVGQSGEKKSLDNVIVSTWLFDFNSHM